MVSIPSYTASAPSSEGQSSVYLPPQYAVAPPKVPPLHIKSSLVESGIYCNCYKTAEELLKIDLPRMVEIKANTYKATVNSVAVMWYGSIKHVAVVIHVDDEFITIAEGNYNRCAFGTRKIRHEDYALHGFYIP